MNMQHVAAYQVDTAMPMPRDLRPIHPIRASIVQEAKDAMQRGEEIWGDMPIQDYIGTMRDVRDDACDRLATVLSRCHFGDFAHKVEPIIAGQHFPDDTDQVHKIFQAALDLHAALYEWDETVSELFSDNLDLTGSYESFMFRLLARNA